MPRKGKILLAKQIRSLPPLPCPSCGANILQMGFHNTCTQLIAVREDNYVEIVDGCIYFAHDQKNHAQVSHDCGTYAYCSNCNRGRYPGHFRASGSLAEWLLHESTKRLLHSSRKSKANFQTPEEHFTTSRRSTRQRLFSKKTI